MGYVESLLATNEKIVFSTRKHLIVIANVLIGGSLAVLLIAAGASIAGVLTGGFGLFLLLLALLPAWQLLSTLVLWSNERYIVTNRRVIRMEGFINKHVTDSSLEKVNDVVLEQSWAGRLLDYGNVEIITGSDIGVNKFERIARPVRFKTEMLNQKERLGREDESPVAAGPAALPSALSRNDIPELIAGLDELRKKGILSDAEFDAKKAELLKQL